MHWDSTAGGGFSQAPPWLSLGETATRNVADQLDDPDSLLTLYRRLIALRQTSDAIGLGDQRSIDLPADSPVVAFIRQAAGDKAAVVVNVSPDEVHLDLRASSRGHLPGEAALLLSTESGRTSGASVDLRELILGPNEGLVLGL